MGLGLRLGLGSVLEESERAINSESISSSKITAGAIFSAALKTART